jgi:peptide methionine sulfoxide reductase MsrB
LILDRSHQLKKVEVSSPEVGANVGDLFSNATNQEQGNIEIVKY